MHPLEFSDARVAGEHSAASIRRLFQRQDLQRRGIEIDSIGPWFDPVFLAPWRSSQATIVVVHTESSPFKAICRAT